MICWLPFYESLRCWCFDDSQHAFTENTAATMFGVCFGGRTPLPTGLKLEESDPNEPEDDWPFRELVTCLMWRAYQNQPDIANVVRAEARYANTPREVNWRTAIGVLE